MAFFTFMMGGTPTMLGFCDGKSHLEMMIWGYPYFRKSPCGSKLSRNCWANTTFCNLNPRTLRTLHALVGQRICREKKDLVVDGWSTPSVAASALEIWRCPKDPRGRHGMTTKIRIETHGDHWGSPCDLRNTHMSSERMKNQEVSGFPRLS